MLLSDGIATFITTALFCSLSTTTVNTMEAILARTLFFPQTRFATVHGGRQNTETRLYE